jgi:hypothetical protein
MKNLTFGPELRELFEKMYYMDDEVEMVHPFFDPWNVPEQPLIAHEDPDLQNKDPLSDEGHDSERELAVEEKEPDVANEEPPPAEGDGWRVTARF